MTKWTGKETAFHPEPIGGIAGGFLSVHVVGVGVVSLPPTTPAPIALYPPPPPITPI